MSSLHDREDPQFRDAVQGLHKGDFSRLQPLFAGQPQCRVIEWFEWGWFATHSKALAEAFTCACFLGQTSVAEFLLTHGVDPSAGASTGLNGFHWAANRGQLDTVRLLIRHNVPMEATNMYGGTVLGTAVWSAINEPKADHVAIIEALISAGARLDTAGYPTGDERVDQVIRRHGA